MKIISYGHIKPKVMRCGGCGAVFEFLPRDVKNKNTGSSKSNNYINCPVCGHTISLSVRLKWHDKYLIFAKERGEDCAPKE